MMEIAGLENSVPVRMVYIDDKTEVLFKSMAHASRSTNITQDAIKKALNPLLKRRFKHNNRDVIFRIVRDK
jgi:TATA-binding protein-associated factor Taf7